MNYTPAQQRAIDSIDGNLQIIACAGSGKTRVVSARVINILRHHRAGGITPDNIVAFTFTDKAAAELKDRITKMYKEEFGNVEGLAGMYVGTIHGFCLDILQRYLYRYLKYDVLDQVKQRLLVDRNYIKSGMKSLGMKRWVESSTYLGLLSMVREADIDSSVPGVNAVLDAAGMYQDLLDDHRYLDYDQIQLEAVQQLDSDPDLREQLRQRVRYLTVDEYQDVSPLQERLIQTLHQLGANLCVVGDDDQNIYQWRGSDVRYMVNFAQNYHDVAQVELGTNFRSTPAIVGVARHAVESNTERLPKQMHSGETRTYERADLLCQRFADLEEEAAWIAAKIAMLRGLPYAEPDGSVRGLAWSDCAVLLRSVRNCAAPIIEALRARGIPFIVAGLAGLFDTLEAQAAAAIFQFMSRTIDEPQLRDAWRHAELGLTDDDLSRGVAVLETGRTFEAGVRFSVYNLQRTYLDFLEATSLREERISNGRGEVVYYNLGKFSQVITDFEEIHYKSAPEEKYRAFVDFLRYQAPGYYPEGGQDVAYAQPDAVGIMTVHQAKGMEYPVVFLPCLQKNRFPSAHQKNKIWDYLPPAAIRDAARYDTGIEEERRLFYVALTRAEKYLFCSSAPDPSVRNNRYGKPSDFWLELSGQERFLTRDPDRLSAERIEPRPRKPEFNVELSFSDLKYFFECPYQFKLRFLYGFNPPLHEALGYGRSLHNALAEIHRDALAGKITTERAVTRLVDEHLNVRYAYPALEENLRNSAQKSLAKYLHEYGPILDRVIHAEEQIELTLPDGILVNGRIDLIKRTDTGEVSVVDFKSTERAQAEDISRMQLHIYALGYAERFGKPADLIEIHNLDDGGSMRELVDARMTDKTVLEVALAGNQLRDNNLPRLAHWCTQCATCDLAGICRTKQAALASL